MLLSKTNIKTALTGLSSPNLAQSTWHTNLAYSLLYYNTIEVTLKTDITYRFQLYRYSRISLRAEKMDKKCNLLQLVNNKYIRTIYIPLFRISCFYPAFLTHKTCCTHTQVSLQKTKVVITQSTSSILMKQHDKNHTTAPINTFFTLCLCLVFISVYSYRNRQNLSSSCLRICQ